MTVSVASAWRLILRNERGKATMVVVVDWRRSLSLSQESGAKLSVTPVMLVCWCDLG